MFVEQTTLDYHKNEQVVYVPKRKVTFQTGKGPCSRWEPEQAWGRAMHNPVNGRFPTIRWIPSQHLAAIEASEAEMAAQRAKMNAMYKAYRHLLSDAFAAGRPLTVEEISADQIAAQTEGAPH
jgi:hypothetical protein